MNKQVKLPEDIAQCVVRILNERRTQTAYNGQDFVGINERTLFQEIRNRLGLERAEVWRKEIKH